MSAKALADQYAEQIVKTYPEDSAVAYESFVKSASTFDASQNDDFWAYACTRAQWAIVDDKRMTGPMTRTGNPRYGYTCRISDLYDSKGEPRENDDLPAEAPAHFDRADDLNDLPPEFYEIMSGEQDLSHGISRVPGLGEFLRGLALWSLDEYPSTNPIVFAERAAGFNTKSGWHWQKKLRRLIRKVRNHAND